MTLREQAEKAVREVRSYEPAGDWAWDELDAPTQQSMIDAIERVARAHAAERMRRLFVIREEFAMTHPPRSAGFCVMMQLGDGRQTFVGSFHTHSEATAWLNRRAAELGGE